MVQQTNGLIQVFKHYEVHGLPISRVKHLRVVVDLLQCTDETRLLKIRVIKARDLMKKDIFGASDPYCKILLYKNNRSTSIVCSPVQTRTVKRSLNPVWNEEIIFRVNPFENRLVFELFDENRITRDDFLGVVSLPLAQLEIGTEGSGQRLVPRCFVLHPRSSRSRIRGNLHLYLVYLPADCNPRVSNIHELLPVSF
ncbi:E3 ubiquitin-protein ligase Nedd-4 [Fasciolopsis buskii]|uniref:E3 ubiquitin-protein ligase Nedd-4 n=1 Tax=Fasciolopsis buskii TaxID=27845 RepID=A0A8E0S2B8_9TREM|nr:E3 ubiquitin-protein ligase Nedd-4 [Fasciolopsis buski]